jgi:hypothetical protein
VIPDTAPIKVKLKETSIEYTIHDVLTLYLSYLIGSAIELEPDKVNRLEFLCKKLNFLLLV